MIDYNKYAEAKAHVETLTDMAIWMSGAEAFGPGGEGEDGWETYRPCLFEAIEWLNAENDDEVADEGPEQLVLFDVDDFDNTWQS